MASANGDHLDDVGQHGRGGTPRSWLTPPVPTREVPRRHLVSLQTLAEGVLDRHAIGDDPALLARDLLYGFPDVCNRAGLDGVLVGLALDEPPVLAALAARLGNKAEFDPRGPRAAQPRQLVECLLAALSLTVIDPPDRTLTLAGALRAEVIAALAGVIDVELAGPHLRDAIVATGRGLCAERYHKVFDRIAAQLDERGLRGTLPAKLPLDAVRAVQQVLIDARGTVIGRAANAAIDRARDVIARANPEAAARLEQPITDRATPRTVAVDRVNDARASKQPAAVVSSLFDSLTELAALAWGVATRTARPYAASHTFAVGDVLDHPTFGRGTVKSVAVQRCEVEFADGTHTLVHARART